MHRTCHAFLWPVAVSHLRYAAAGKRGQWPAPPIPAQANAEKISSTALSWLPVAEDGTRIGVETPASRHAATPSRTAAAGPNSVASASQRSLIREGMSLWRPRRSRSRSRHLLDVAGLLPVIAVVRQRRVAGQRAAVDRFRRLDVVGMQVGIMLATRKSGSRRFAAGITDSELPICDRLALAKISPRRSRPTARPCAFAAPPARSAAMRRSLHRSGISRQRRGYRRAVFPASRPCGYGSGACATPMPKRNRPPETSWI